MNYVDGQYIIDIVPVFLNQVHPHEIRIAFPSGTLSPKVECPEAFKKAISYASASLRQHAESEEVDIDRISDIQLIARGTRMGVHYIVQARDDRDVEYDITIQSTA